LSTEHQQQWIAAWRRAGPELQRIGNEELRRLDEIEGTRLATFLGVAQPGPARSGSGLAVFQVYMKKWRTLTTMNEQPLTGSTSDGPDAS
jgi:hypothetical protein